MNGRAGQSLIVLTVLTAVVLGITLTGCTGDSGDRTPSPEQQPAPPPVVAEPGLYERDGGLVGAVGVFARLEDQNGSWAVVGVADTQTAQSFVVAIVEGVEELAVDLAAYQGRYVEVRGALLEEGTAASETPLIRAQSIEVLVEDDPDDPVF